MSRSGTMLVSILSVVSATLFLLEVHGTMELQRFWPEPGFRPLHLPLGSVLRCAARCCHDALCPGFDVTLPVTLTDPDASCTLLRLPSIPGLEGNANVTRYWKKHGFVMPVLGVQPQVPTCGVLGAVYRASSGRIRLLFPDDEWYEWPIGSNWDVAAITWNSPVRSGTTTTTYTLPTPRTDITAAMQMSDTLIMLFYDADVSVHRYSSGTGNYVLLPGYPHSLAQELSPAAVLTPAFVSSAYTESSRVYLLSAATVFEYHVTGTAFADYLPGTEPTWDYEFAAMYEFSAVDGGNPFGPPPDSGLAAPPSCQVTALAGNDARLVAFCGAAVYRFRRDTTTWAGVGNIPASTCGGGGGGGGGEIDD